MPTPSSPLSLFYVIAVLLAWLTTTATPATLRLSFALAAGLRTLVVRASTSLGEDAVLLNLAVEALERQLKRIARVHSDFTHRLLPAGSAVA